MYDAYWADRGGKLYQVSQSHIRYILDYPERFGWKSSEEIRDVYRKHGEKFGWEGKARREVMLKAMTDGWIRVRGIGNAGWVFEYLESSSGRRAVKKAMEEMIDSGSASYDDSVRVTSYVVNGDTERVARTDSYSMDTATGEGGVVKFLAASTSPAMFAHRSVAQALLAVYRDKDPEAKEVAMELSKLGYPVSSASAVFRPQFGMVWVKMADCPKEVKFTFNVNPDQTGAEG